MLRRTQGWQAIALVLLVVTPLIYLAMHVPQNGGESGIAPESLAHDLVPAVGPREPGAVLGLPPVETGRVEVLDSFTSVSGVVLDADGHPVTGATVEDCDHEEVVTDARGGFALHHLAPGDHWLQARAIGFSASAAAPVRVDAEQPISDVVLVLQRAHALIGCVTSAGGGPILGATIRAQRAAREDDDGLPRVASPYGPSEWTTTSDASGGFRLEGLGKERLTVTVQHSDYLGFGRTLSPGPAPLLVKLRRSPGVGGRVVDPEGRPVLVERVTVLVSRSDEDGPWQVLGEPFAIAPEQGEVGMFRVPIRTPRPVRVVAECAGWAPAVSPPIRVVAGGADVALSLRTTPGATLIGRVRDDRGKPVPGAAVVLREAHDDQALVQAGPPFELAPVYTGVDGRFVSAPLASGSYSVAVQHAGFAPSESRIFEVRPRIEPEPLELQLTRYGSIEGRLEGLARNGSPSFWVRALRIPPNGQQALPTHARPPQPAIMRVTRAGFRLDDLVVGRYALELLSGRDPLAAGKGLERIELDVSAGRATRVALDAPLVGSGSVEGTLWVNGVRATGVAVFLRGTSHSLRWNSATDQDGRFVFACVPRGLHVLSAGTAADFGQLGQEAIDTPARGVMRHDLRLSTGPLSGRAVDGSTGAPLPRAEVRLERVLPGLGTVPVATGITDADGRFSWRHAPAATLLVSVSKRFQAAIEKLPVDVLPGRGGELPELQLAQAGELTVLVRGAPEQLRGPVEVLVTRGGGQVPELVRELDLSSSRTLVLEGLLPDSVTVVVRSPARNAEARSVARVVPGERRTVVLTF